MVPCLPVVNMVQTGQNIRQIRKQCGLTVKDLQDIFGFATPQAIYKWQQGKSLPTVDNLYALGALLEVSMNEILVSAQPKLHILSREQQVEACCSPVFCTVFLQQRGTRQKSGVVQTILAKMPSLFLLRRTF